MSLVSELERLQQLHEDGAISEDEFRRAKEALLSQHLDAGERERSQASPHRRDTATTPPVPQPPPPPPSPELGTAGDDTTPSSTARLIGGVLAVTSLLVLFAVMTWGADLFERVSLPSVGGGPDTIDMERVERQISSRLSTTPGEIGVECPSGVEAAPGRDFRCTMKYAEDPNAPFPGRIDASVQNSAGDVFWETVVTRESRGRYGYFWESQQGHVLRAIAD